MSLSATTGGEFKPCHRMPMSETARGEVGLCCEKSLSETAGDESRPRRRTSLSETVAGSVGPCLGMSHGGVLDVGGPGELC